MLQQSHHPNFLQRQNFALLYEQPDMIVKDYKSILRVVDGGKTVLTKTIGINDPLKYKGYVFYQSSYDPEGQKYTGLQVIRNPGLYVYVGEFKNDKKHGHGTLTIPNGEKYVGEWKNGTEQRFNEFTSNNKVKIWPSMDDLVANPFVYEGKIIGISANFWKMESATSGVFTEFTEAGGDLFPLMIIVSNIPKGLFTTSDIRVILTGKVLGTIEFQMPVLGPTQVPHLRFIDYLISNKSQK